MSFLPAKTLIFLQDTKIKFTFLVNSGASLSILPHRSTALPTDPHLVGANGKSIPAWGFCHRTIFFSGQNLEFDFLLAAIATPLLGMDFFSKVWSFNYPLKTAGPARGLGPHLLQGKYVTTSFISPWGPETAVAALPPQVQQLLQKFPSLLRPSAAQTAPQCCASH
jgi:hypothetical protein